MQVLLYIFIEISKFINKWNIDDTDFADLHGDKSIFLKNL